MSASPPKADSLFGALSEMSSLDWKEIEVRYRGKPIKGRYNVSDNLVTVAAWNGTKTAQLGIFPRGTIGANAATRISGPRRNKIGRSTPAGIKPVSPPPASKMRQ